MSFLFIHYEQYELFFRFLSNLLILTFFCFYCILVDLFVEKQYSVLKVMTEWIVITNAVINKDKLYFLYASPCDS